MSLIVDKAQRALESEGPGAAVSVLESLASNGANTASICRAALLILASSEDSGVSKRLLGVLTNLRSKSAEDYLLELVVKVCEQRSGRIDVDVGRLQKRFKADGGKRPLVLTVYEGMELFNKGRGRDAIHAFSQAYRATGNMHVRDLLMKAYLRTAYYHIAKERYERAAEILKTSLEIDSYNVESLHTLAILETESTTLSSLDEIEHSWVRLIDIWKALDKIYPDSGYRERIICKYKYFAAMYLKAGNWKMASRELSGLLEADPDDELAKEVLAAISE